MVLGFLAGKILHYWDPLFFEFCMAIGGSLKFDLQIYRSRSGKSAIVSAAAQDLLWQANVAFVSFTVRELMTDVLGYSETLRNAKLEQKLRLIGARLHDAEVIRFVVSSFAPDNISRTCEKGEI